MKDGIHFSEPDLEYDTDDYEATNLKSSELTKAKFYYDVVLQDDASPFGGVSHRGETLREFMDETYSDYCLLGRSASPDGDESLPGDTDMSEVNYRLTECGIEPIDFHFNKERLKLAAIVGMKSDNDADLECLDKITDFVENYDFGVVTKDGELFLDFRKALADATEYATRGERLSDAQLLAHRYAKGVER